MTRTAWGEGAWAAINLLNLNPTSYDMTDLPGWLPMEDPDDTWAEGENVDRLSTRMPGLGNETRLIDLYALWMEAVAERDPDVADFLSRARDPYVTWLWELLTHLPEVMEGCHPT